MAWWYSQNPKKWDPLQKLCALQKQIPDNTFEVKYVGPSTLKETYSLFSDPKVAYHLLVIENEEIALKIAPWMHFN